MLIRFGRQVASWQDCRKTVRLLRGLGAHLLDDAGISRDNVRVGARAAPGERL